MKEFVQGVHRFSGRARSVISAGIQVGLLVALIGTFAPNARAQGSVVTVDSNNVLVINGTKVFALGFSPGPPLNGTTPWGADAMQELRDAGGNIYRMNQSGNWSPSLMTQQQSVLDWAGQHGMFVWLNLNELSEFATGDTNTAASLKNLVDTFRNHPALGVWKNYDEAWWGGISAQNLLNGYNVIKGEDTNHPVEQTHAPRGTVSNLVPYNVAADVIAVDIYPVVASGSASNPPITNTQVSQVGDWANEIAQVAGGQKEFWVVEQIAFSGTTPPTHTLVFPTFQQSRFMAYQAIVNGARGLMFFGGNITNTLNSQDMPYLYNWTFWTNVLKPLVLELGDKGLLTAALTTSNSTLPITFSGTTAPDIEFCVREVPPYLYIIASKREGATVNVTFSGLPSWAALGDVLYESPRSVAAQNGQFTDTFAQWDVHVYRFAQSNQPPVIISQPQSVTNYAGSTTVFNVTAGGTAPLTYQWQKNGTNMADSGHITGSQTSSLTISNISVSDGAAYDVIVSGLGSVTSAPPAILTVNTQTNQSPTITAQPQSRTNAVGSTATFSVTASGPGTLTYQWQKNGANLTNGGNLSGVTSTNLMLTNVAMTDAGAYNVVITGVGSVTSAPPAVLTVIQLPVITMQPLDFFEANAGSMASFTVAASGAGLSYQWQKNSVNLTDGGEISGTQTPTLTLSSVTSGDTANYAVVISNSAGSVTSSSGFLYVIYPMPYFDPFNYTAGAHLGGQVNGNLLGWSDIGTATAGPYVVVGTNSLSIPGLAPSTGNCIEFGGLGKSVRFSFPTGYPVTSGTLYYSHALKVVNTNGLSSGIFMSGFNNSVGSQTGQPTVIATRLYIQATNGGFNLGLSKASSTSTDWVWDPRTFTTNQTIFIVGSYTFTGSNDVSQMWINPSSNTFGAVTAPSPSLTTGNGGNISSSQIASFIFVQRQATQPAGVLADELRIGTSWADVTPPSAPIRPTLVGLSGPGGGFQFGFTNNTGHSYSVYMSTDLVNWISLGAPTEVAPAFFEFADGDATTVGQRFYQLRSP